MRNKITIHKLDDNLKEISSIEAEYNPTEYSIETKNQYQRTAMPGLSVPVTQFISGETQTISLKLFFDTYLENPKDVRTLTKPIVQLMEIDSSLHHPPVCKFTWNNKTIASTKESFFGVIDSCSQNYTMFLEDGTPVRASLTLNISEYRKIDQQLNELKLESPDRTKYRILKEGDTLWLMSFREYNDPNMWRQIAIANNIDNPRLIAPGTVLMIPPLEGQ